MTHRDARAQHAWSGSRPFPRVGWRGKFSTRPGICVDDAIGAVLGPDEKTNVRQRVLTGRFPDERGGDVCTHTAPRAE
jgi:hypothetical protein